MKQYLSIFIIIAFAYSANGQNHTYKKDTTKTRTCFDEYYESFVERGALAVPDGDQNVVFSARKGDSTFCGEGKVYLKGGKIQPYVTVKKTDGTYEQAKKTLHPNMRRGEQLSANSFTVYKGMSSTFLTDDEWIINLFFIDQLKRKVVPNAQAPSPDQIAGVQIETTMKEKEIIMKAYEGLKFENGKSTIKASSYPHLDLFATMLLEKKNYNLKINGYTDNVGKPENNLQLSRNRAAAVKTYLIKKGVEGTRISTNGYGEENPIADNNTNEGRAKNRRVEFLIVE